MEHGKKKENGLKDLVKAKDICSYDKKAKVLN